MSYNQEELSNLFQRNLSLQQPPPAPAQEPAPPTVEINYSISQHYHHSSHVVPTRASAAAPVPTDDHTIAIILSRHGVDPSTLFPSQLELFRSADASQQMRLVELWRISPPSYGGHAMSQEMGVYPETNLEQEEAMARVRYEERMQMEEQLQASARSQDMSMSDDLMSEGEQSNAPLTPIQGGDARWCSTAPEPYMVSGYEELAKREYEASVPKHEQVQPQGRDAHSVFGTGVGGNSYNKATDPVYASSGPNYSWGARSQEEQQMAMACQYGAYSQQLRANDGCHDDQEML